MAKTSYIKTIEDTAMNPYFITMDDYCYTVYQDCSKDQDKSYTKKLGHFSKFNNALEKIVTHKTNSNDYSSLEDYLDAYKEIKNQVLQTNLNL